MTENADTFRQGAGAFRNVRDWTNKQRGNLVRQANERALLEEVKIPADNDDAGTSPALSLATAASEIEALSSS